MKLRIQGQSIRLRLDADEVQRLVRDGIVEEAVAFDPGQPLVYALRTSEEARQPTATFEHGRLMVTLPAAAASRWAASDELSLHAEQARPRVLIEKDLPCGDHRASGRSSRSESTP